MALAPEKVAAISRRLAAHAGLELPAWVVEARANARIAALGIEDDDDYVTLISTGRGAGELDELIEAVRVGESRLFRHRSQIAAVIDVVVPALRARGKRAIRVWSAGCAAGEEPYTLAAVLSQAMPGVTVSIIATDVSADALEAAACASYPASAWNDIPDDWRDAFELAGDRVRVRPEIAALVRFERANLATKLEREPIRGCDLVWCRNVLIYFTPEARKLAIDRLIAATNPDGFLFAGYSESLRDIPELEAMRAGETVYYVRRSGDLRRTPPMGVARITAENEPIAIPRTMTPGVMVVHGVNRTPASGMPVVGIADRTPPPVLVPRVPPAPDQHVLQLRGQPTAREVTLELTTRLSIRGLEHLIVDLDGADLLDDDLAQVLRRARAAARAAHVELTIRATRTGSRRWLTRHELDEDAP